MNKSGNKIGCNEKKRWTICVQVETKRCAILGSTGLSTERFTIHRLKQEISR